LITWLCDKLRNLWRSQRRVVVFSNFEIALLLLVLFSFGWGCVHLLVVLSLELRSFNIYDSCLGPLSSTSTPTPSLLAISTPWFTVATASTPTSAATPEGSLLFYRLLIFHFLFLFLNGRRLQLFNLLRQLGLPIRLVPLMSYVDFIYFFVQVFNWNGGTDLDHAKLLDSAHIKIKNVFVFDFLLFLPFLLLSPTYSSELLVIVSASSIHEFSII